jgi:hypothetical protein
MTATSLNCSIKRQVKSYYPIPDRRFEGRSVIFKRSGRQYLPAMVSDFTGFIVQMVGNEKFSLEIEKKWLTVEFQFNGYQYMALCPDLHDGLGCDYIASSNTKEDALYNLIEQISEKILSEQ